MKSGCAGSFRTKSWRGGELGDQPESLAYLLRLLQDLERQHFILSNSK